MEILRDGDRGLFFDLFSEMAPDGDQLLPMEYPGATKPLGHFAPVVGERTLEIFDHAEDPEDPFELRDLFLGRVECECEAGNVIDPRAVAWRSRRRRRKRELTADDILSSRVTVRFVKELFNSYFRDDLYGRFRSPDTVILSSGSVCETNFGLPEAIKASVRFALQRDWYGYSDSCGRLPAREAIASYENARMDDARYSGQNVAITMGATSSINALSDFFLSGRVSTAPALCAIPNYPPLVESIARRHEVKQVPIVSEGGQMSLQPLIDSLTPATPLVLLQTAANPTGAIVDEHSLTRLIDASSPSTMILLDECHECLGGTVRRAKQRACSNVVRITSMSKTWSIPGMKVGWILADPAVIADYYEFASTSYGGPPSFFYTLVETVARMERWLIEGIDSPGHSEIAEFEPSYGLELEAIQAAFRSYSADRADRERTLVANRTLFLGALSRCGFSVLPPVQSINATIASQWNDSYVSFRNLMAKNNVSVFPSTLLFGYDAAEVRITTARSARDLQEALSRLSRSLSDGGLYESDLGRCSELE